MPVQTRLELLAQLYASPMWAAFVEEAEAGMRQNRAELENVGNAREKDLVLKARISKTLELINLPASAAAQLAARGPRSDG